MSEGERRKTEWWNVPDNAREYVYQLLASQAAGLRQNAAHGDLNEEVEAAAQEAEDDAGAAFQRNLGTTANVMQASVQAGMQLASAEGQVRRQARALARKHSAERLLSDALDLARETLMSQTENDGGIGG